MICGEEWGQRHASPGGTLQKIQTLVPQDFPDPETETVRFTASREVLIRFYQGVLHNICGGVRIQSHPTGTPEQESLVPADQHFKSVPLAVQDLSHQHSIGGFDAGRTEWNNNRFILRDGDFNLHGITSTATQPPIPSSVLFGKVAGTNQCPSAPRKAK